MIFIPCSFLFLYLFSFSKSIEFWHKQRIGFCAHSLLYIDTAAMHSGAPDEPAPKRYKSDAPDEPAPSSLTQARQMWLVEPTPSSLRQARQMIVEACRDMRVSMCHAIESARIIKRRCDRLVELLDADQEMDSEAVEKCVEDLGGMGVFGATQSLESHATDVIELTEQITLTVRESTQQTQPTIQETTQTIQE